MLVAVHSDCAVSAPWCQKMPQGGPIAARYSLRKEQSGVRDRSHHDKSAGRSCVVTQGFDFIRRWRGPLLAFSASKAVIFCNRAPLRHFLPRRPRLDAMDDSEERGVVAHARRLPSAPGLSALSLAASPWRLLLSVRVALSAAFCERSLFLLSPHVEPPCSSCGVNAFETHITLRCNMRVTLVKRCIHTLETLHSLPSPCDAAHRHALVATRPPRLELPGLGQWGK